jgi:hypothetical protein
MYIILVIFLLVLIVKFSKNKKQYFFNYKYRNNTNGNLIHLNSNPRKKYNTTYRSYPLYIGEHKYYSFMK